MLAAQIIVYNHYLDEIYAEEVQERVNLIVVVSRILWGLPYKIYGDFHQKCHVINDLANPIRSIFKPIIGALRACS